MSTVHPRMHSVAVIVRPVATGTDDYGDPIMAPSAVASAPALVVPAQSGEEADRRETRIDEVTLLLPAGIDLLATDDVEVDGVHYELVTPPLQERTLVGHVHHTVVRARHHAG